MIAAALVLALYAPAQCDAWRDAVVAVTVARDAWARTSSAADRRADALRGALDAAIVEARARERAGIAFDQSIAHHLTALRASDRLGALWREDARQQRDRAQAAEARVWWVIGGAAVVVVAGVIGGVYAGARAGR